jgi:hypothetical protein
VRGTGAEHVAAKLGRTVVGDGSPRGGAHERAGGSTNGGSRSSSRWSSEAVSQNDGSSGIKESQNGGGDVKEGS